jgi:type IV pilus modification protein PilV
MNKHLRKRTGYSTLDALAGLMVLNLLCLGVLAMQWQALQAHRDAWALQTAVALSQDLWERMQINPQAAQSYQLQLGQTAPATQCQSQACTPTQWALADLYAWQNAVQLRLPGAKTQLNTVSSSQVQLLLAWPVDALSASLYQPADQGCPTRFRCWKTSWNL